MSDVSVCVWTICTDVKLPSVCFLLLFVVCSTRFSSHLCRGTQHFTGTVSNEATSEMGYPAWPAGRTCIRFCSRDGMWITQEPPCRFIWHVLLLHCCRNLGLLSTKYVWFCYIEPSSEQGRRKHTSLWCSRWINQFSCQTLLDCLCTCDAFHISNSIRCFWASVSLIPLSDKVVWALRGKPF